VKAIRNHRDEYVTWPDSNERQAIACRIQDICGLPNCVGIVDGTLFPLALRPETVDSPDYKGRKFVYTLSAMVVNDDQRRIRFYISGWPGSTHDNRVARNSKMWIDPEHFFDHNQYIIGDSAYENHWFVVSAYTAPPGEQVPPDLAAFNSVMSKARVVSEHTIGLLKGRFPWLRSIRRKITEKVKTLTDILSFLDACVVIHNFLITRNLETHLDEWKDDDDDASEIDNYSRLPPDDELNQQVPQGAAGDFRRTSLLYYLQDQGV
jgi:hypothetical protein